MACWPVWGQLKGPEEENRGARPPRSLLTQGAARALNLRLGLAAVWSAWCRLPSVTRLMPLDGLRGLAVLLVLASHASNVGLDLAPGLKASGLGLPGVFLFFVLSSFLLTGQLLDSVDGSRPIGWPRFAARRLLRILPAYALALGVHVIAGAIGVRAALEHMVFVRAEGHFWTIPVEMLFYLTLPPLVLLLALFKGPWPRLLLLAVVGVGARWAFPPDFLGDGRGAAPVVAPFLPVFLVGAGLAVLRPLWTEALGPGRRTVLLVLGSVAAAVLFALTPAVWSVLSGQATDYRRFHLWFDAFSGLWGFVVVAAVQQGGGPLGWIRGFASWAPLRWVGQISYSVYLFHALLLGLFVEHGAAWGLPLGLQGPAFLAASLAVGTLSYFLVERPFLGVLRVSR